MRVYISGAITGTHDYMHRFAKAEAELKKQGYSVINPAAVNSRLPSDTTYEEYMKMSLTMLDMCDAIYMLKGWEKSCGANREYGYALTKDYVVMREQEDNKNALQDAYDRGFEDARRSQDAGIKEESVQ